MYVSNFYSIKHYQEFWKDLQSFAHFWNRVLVPASISHEMGASEAIHASIDREKIAERVSPIVFMRAQKNDVERDGMRWAHIRDAVAVCYTFSNLEERVSL